VNVMQSQNLGCCLQRNLSLLPINLALTYSTLSPYDVYCVIILSHSLSSLTVINKQEDASLAYQNVLKLIWVEIDKYLENHKGMQRIICKRLILFHPSFTDHHTNKLPTKQHFPIIFSSIVSIHQRVKAC